MKRNFLATLWGTIFGARSFLGEGFVAPTRRTMPDPGFVAPKRTRSAGTQHIAKRKRRAKNRIRNKIAAVSRRRNRA